MNYNTENGSNGKALAYVRENLFRYGHFKPFARELLEKIGCLPNWIYQADTADIGRLRVQLSCRSRKEDGDWSISDNGAQYLASAQQEGKAICFMALTSDYRTVDNVESIEVVIDNLRGVSPRLGRYGGPYFWVDKLFRPASSVRAVEITDPDAAF